nr:hypothetical protein CFP56_10957 [Quercus suber]POF00895.1 hypothetical protein CFP56_20843 [Quercus suber]
MPKDGQLPCVRCKKRGLPCAVNKSLQMILDSDADWKAKIDRKIRRLEASIGKVTGHLTLDLTEDESEHEDAGGPLKKRAHPPAHAQAQSEKHSSHNFEIVMDPDSGPAAIPGSVVFPVLVPDVKQCRADQDTITRGIITVDQAQSYLDLYQNRSVSSSATCKIVNFADHT